jgi:23S rRNA (adenine2030-N6)-methyltransferase
MNYRHLYHAGNPGDVVKHVVLVMLLERLLAKPTPISVLDTHAGIGRYDLTASEAIRGGEAPGGIGKLWERRDLPPPVQFYLDLVRALNPDGALRWYPGSPRLARALLRADDRLVLCELHPEDVQTLRREFRDDSQTGVHHQDGWTALKALLPPTPRRGLVLIDPPFEAPDDYQRLVAGLQMAHGRWPTGVYALWYPIKDPASVWSLHEGLAESAIRRILLVEMTWREPGTAAGSGADPRKGLQGCGLALVNPPWQFDDELRDVLPALHAVLAAGGGGAVRWLVQE